MSRRSKQAPGRAARAPVALGREPESREWVLWLLWLCVAVPVVLRRLTSSDSWWHMHWGRWWLQHGRLPDFAQFYFTPVQAAGSDFRSTVLGDITLYLVHAVAGSAGLQILSFLALAGAALLLRSLSRTPLRGWETVALMALAVGTYQLQIPRNALISLPLMALCLLWLDQWSRERRLRALWLLCPLLALWSGFHGSAVFGWLLCALFLAGDAVDAWRKGEGFGRQGARLPHTAGVLALTFCLICAGNETAMQIVRLPVRRFHEARALHPPPAPAAPSAAASAPPPMGGVAGWLNRLLWRSGPGGVRSVEFDSPFLRLHTALVVVTFALIVCAWVAAALTRPVRCAWLAALTLTSLMALCYLRFVGYGAIGAVAFLFGGAALEGPWGERWRAWQIHGRVSAAFAAILVLLSWWTGGLPSALGVPDHAVGFGKSAAFSDRVYDWVLQEHPGQRVFTTIVTGSYALERWAGKMPVFIDGFFAPHPAALWADYRRVRVEGNPELLFTKYGAELAIVENSRPDWTALFLGSPQWRPVAVSSGCLVLARASLVPRGAAPALLVDEAAAAQLPPADQRALAVVYGGTMMALAAHRDFAAAAAFEQADPKISALLHSQVGSVLKP